jgi:hypothetical protein
MPPIDVSMWYKRGPPSAHAQAGYSVLTSEEVTGAGTVTEEKNRYSKGAVMPIAVTYSKVATPDPLRIGLCGRLAALLPQSCAAGK